MSNSDQASEYWKDNVKLILQLMSIWFVVSFGCGIIFAEALNNISLGGYKLGFWFAQQGSIYTFVALIYVYTRKMAALDKKYNVEE
jgi:putative solute:sodium symporter small subunit